MSQWLELKIPELGYILEFAFPENDRMLVRTTNGLYCVALKPVKVESVMSAEEIEVLDNGDSWGTEQSLTLSFDDEEWYFLGADGGDGGEAILRQTSQKEQIEVSNDRKDLLILNSTNHKLIQKIDYIIAKDPDDFCIAGFSLDEEYLILCTNEKLRVFNRAEE